MCAICLLLVFVEALVDVLSAALSLAIILRAIQSWIPSLRLPLGLGPLVVELTEPLERPIRRLVPSVGGVDFSPFVALLAVQALTIVVLRLLPPAV